MKVKHAPKPMGFFASKLDSRDRTAGSPDTGRVNVNEPGFMIMNLPACKERSWKFRVIPSLKSYGARSQWASRRVFEFVGSIFHSHTLNIWYPHGVILVKTKEGREGLSWLSTRRW